MTISCEAKVDDGFTEFNFEHRLFRIGSNNSTTQPIYGNVISSVVSQHFWQHSWSSLRGPLTAVCAVHSADERHS
jgi:hypothetical protein